MRKRKRPPQVAGFSLAPSQFFYSREIRSVESCPAVGATFRVKLIQFPSDGSASLKSRNVVLHSKVVPFSVKRKLNEGRDLHTTYLFCPSPVILVKIRPTE
ncbi:hypothetical protein R1flu_006093 [Riccia fluitans]|uniref:Uncharacterized protein n=1 Tax=Riccia fluitans TaxID=41844 RepID=A0ABD1YXV8_9MARC